MTADRNLGLTTGVVPCATHNCHSWYVGYRSCDGIDSRSLLELCGFVQVSLRAGTGPDARFVASVKNVGQSTTFGQSVKVTVTALQDIPLKLDSGLDSPSSSVRIRVVVNRP